MLAAAILVAVVMAVQASHPAQSYHHQGAPSNNEAYVNKVNADHQHYVNRIAANIATGHASYHNGPSHYQQAPSNNEAYVNKINAERQLHVNRIAAKIGTGAGTGFIDGVPGTPLSKQGGYKANLGNYAYGGYGGHGYGYNAHGNAYGGYGNGAYGNHAYGYNAYGNGAYGNGAYSNVAYGKDAYGKDAYGKDAYGKGVYGNGVYGNGAYGNGAYGSGAHYGHRAGYAATSYGHGKEDNAFRQHQVNLIALHHGTGVGTAPLYGVPGTRLAAHKHNAAHKAPKTYTA